MRRCAAQDRELAILGQGHAMARQLYGPALLEAVLHLDGGLDALGQDFSDPNLTRDVVRRTVPQRLLVHGLRQHRGQHGHSMFSHLPVTPSRRFSRPFPAGGVCPGGGSSLISGRSPTSTAPRVPVAGLAGPFSRCHCSGRSHALRPKPGGRTRAPRRGGEIRGFLRGPPTRGEAAQQNHTLGIPGPAPQPGRRASHGATGTPVDRPGVTRLSPPLRWP